jgi:hypothetical protein
MLVMGLGHGLAEAEGSMTHHPPDIRHPGKNQAGTRVSEGSVLYYVDDDPVY